MSERLALEGSYEITPYFQRDIDSLRLVSPRFVAMLVFGAGLLTLVWELVGQSTPELYQFALGALVLIQLTVHIRHLRNLFMFRAMIKSDEVRGRIEYSRPLILRMSSVELFTFSGFYFLLFVFTQNWFMMGGAFKCFSTAVAHRRLMRKLPPTATNQELEAVVR